MNNIFKNWTKPLYIATVKEVKTDDYGNDIYVYNMPQLYRMNIQPANGSTDIALYGEKVSKIYKAIIPYNKFINKFNEGDVAYLEGANPSLESTETYGIDANYRIISVRPQNTMICVYFEKIKK